MMQNAPAIHHVIDRMIGWGCIEDIILLDLRGMAGGVAGDDAARGFYAVRVDIEGDDFRRAVTDGGQRVQAGAGADIEK